MFAFHITTVDQLIPEVLSDAGRCGHMKPDLILSQGAQVIVAFQSLTNLYWQFLDEDLARISWIGALLQLNHRPEIRRHQGVHRVYELALRDVSDSDRTVFMDRLFGAHRAFREQDRRHNGTLGDRDRLHRTSSSMRQIATFGNSKLKRVSTYRERSLIGITIANSN